MVTPAQAELQYHWSLPRIVAELEGQTVSGRATNREFVGAHYILILKIIVHMVLLTAKWHQQTYYATPYPQEDWAYPK